MRYYSEHHFITVHRVKFTQVTFAKRHSKTIFPFLKSGIISGIAMY